MGKPTFLDLIEGHQKDLKRVYKLSPRALEQRVKRELDGANAKERRDFFEVVYNNKRKS